MAAALSRALKLPGKKGSDLGEYDPLTQADSDDDSEEDDLVLNYPRNGLGRGGCLGPGTAEPRGSRMRLEEEEEELEEEEERGVGTGKKQVGTGAGVGPGQVGDPEGKKARVRGAIRTTAFLLPLACATLTVLLCAFLLPCRQGALEHPQWETQLWDVGGVMPPQMALWDVDGDGMEDLLIAVTKFSNNSQQISSVSNSKEYSVVALDGASGEMMWSRPMKEAVSSLQCGLRTTFPENSGTQRENVPPVCLLITRSHLTAINASSGKKLWSVPAGEVESRAVAVPDLQGDGVLDLLIATLPAEHVSDLSLVLHSGMDGSLIGRPVNFNLTTEGKLIGPLLHETVVGAYYILIGLGTVEAIPLRDLYKKATNGTSPPPSLGLKDPIWEKQRRSNRSSLIHIYSGPDHAEYLLPLVVGVSNNCNNLDPQSNRNSSRSNWVLQSTNSKVSVIRARDTHTSWTINSTLHSHPAFGHFNDDGVPDLLIQQSVNVRKVQIIDGARGVSLWEAEFVCPHLALEGSTILTTTGQSVFLFWAGDPLPASRNTTKVSTPEPILRRLFLLHPAYPTVLQQLMSTTDTALTATVSYQEIQKDSSYVVVLSRPVSGLGPGAKVVKSMSVRALLATALTVHLEQDNKAASSSHTPTAFQINKFFRQLSFRQQ